MTDYTQTDVDELAGALADAWYEFVPGPLAIGLRDCIAEHLLRSNWYAQRVADAKRQALIGGSTLLGRIAQVHYESDSPTTAEEHEHAAGLLLQLAAEVEPQARQRT